MCIPAVPIKIPLEFNSPYGCRMFDKIMKINLEFVIAINNVFQQHLTACQ